MRLARHGGATQTLSPPFADVSPERQMPLQHLPATQILVEALLDTLEPLIRSQAERLLRDLVDAGLGAPTARAEAPRAQRSARARRAETKSARPRRRATTSTAPAVGGVDSEAESAGSPPEAGVAVSATSDERAVSPEPAEERGAAKPAAAWRLPGDSMTDPSGQRLVKVVRRAAGSPST